MLEGDDLIAGELILARGQRGAVSEGTDLTQTLGYFRLSWSLGVVLVTPVLTSTMDDDMEDEIIYEVFTTHAYIIWRYLGVTTAGLVDLIMPGPGESLRAKILQPGPFLFLMFLVIVASVAVQSSSHLLRQWMLKAHYLLGSAAVADTTFKTLSGLDLSGSLGGKIMDWEMREGIVGLYGMQGRRGSMEDRYSIVQDVDVGDKMMSFFGVFDGHGGQVRRLALLLNFCFILSCIHVFPFNFYFIVAHVDICLLNFYFVMSHIDICLEFLFYNVSYSCIAVEFLLHNVPY